jgi:hypothetical protein
MLEYVPEGILTKVDVDGSPVNTPPVQVSAVPGFAAFAIPVTLSNATAMAAPHKKRILIT